MNKEQNFDLIYRVLKIIDGYDHDNYVEFVPREDGRVRIFVNDVGLFSHDDDQPPQELTLDTVDEFDQAMQDVVRAHLANQPDKAPMFFGRVVERIGWPHMVMRDVSMLYCCRRRKLTPLLDEGELGCSECVRPLVEALPYPRANPDIA